MKLHPYLSDLTQEDDVIAIQLSASAEELTVLVEAVVKTENSPNPRDVRGFDTKISIKESKELVEYLISRTTQEDGPAVVGPFVNSQAELMSHEDAGDYAEERPTIGFYDTAVGVLTLHSELRCRVSPFGLDRLTVYCEDEKGRKLLPSMYMYNTEIEFEYTKTKFNFK